MDTDLLKDYLEFVDEVSSDQTKNTDLTISLRSAPSKVKRWMKML